jgi:hypothetical protein
VKVVVNLTRAYRDLEAELEPIPLRERAEYLRLLAVQGLYHRRQIDAGMAGLPAGMAAGAPQAAPAPAAEPPDAENRRKLRGKGLASLRGD